AQAVPGALDANDPQAAAVARLAALLPADETQLVYSMALHGRAELGLAPDEYSGLVMVLLRMLAFRPQGSGALAATAQRHAGASPGDLARRRHDGLAPHGRARHAAHPRSARQAAGGAGAVAGRAGAAGNRGRRGPRFAGASLGGRTRAPPA